MLPIRTRQSMEAGRGGPHSAHDRSSLRLSSTYALYLCQRSRGTPVWYLFKPSTLPVVHHGDEVPFVFQSSYLKGKENIALGQAMAEMWYTFAATERRGLLRA